MHIPDGATAAGATPASPQPSHHPLSPSNRSPSLSLSSTDEEEMDTAENRKRRHQSDSPEEYTRPAGDGSLLTNTSLNPNRRTRLSTTDISSPDLTSTPDRIDIQMNTIRGAAAAVAPELQTIPSDDEDYPLPGDQSTASNIRRVDHMVQGVVSLTRRNANTLRSDQALAWDNQDLALSPNINMTSPLPRPNIHSPSTSAPSPAPTPPPTVPTMPSIPSVPPPATDSDLSSQLQKTFKECFDKAYRTFETDMLATIGSLQTRVDENTATLSTVTERITNIEQVNQANTAIQEDTQARVRENTEHLERIDTNLVNINQNGILNALQERVSQLENALQERAAASGNISPNNNPSNLTPAEVTRIRNDQLKEDDHYFLSTIQLKGFSPPVNAYRKDRNAAREILKLTGSEDILASVKIVKFSENFSSLRLTFDDPFACHDAKASLSFASSQILSNGQSPGFKYTILTPPRFHEQRSVLFKKAMEMKSRGEIGRFSFLVRNDLLCVRLSKRGQRDVILPFRQPAPDQMETDDNEKCSICLLGFDNGDLRSMRCGHLFHHLCIKTSLGKSLECPTCKVSQPLTEEMRKCQRCSNDTNVHNDRVRYILARKCGHIHSANCQAVHLLSLPDQFPLSPASVIPLLESPHPGCHSCSTGNQSPDLESSFLTPVQYYPGIREFNNPDDPQQPTPASPSQEETPPTVPQSRPPPLFSGLTGSNTAPLGQRNRRRANAPRSLPPATEQRQRTRSRS